ncbi:MAG: hypothetical protein ABJB03_00395 [Rhodoglobus sp.]
MTTTPTRVHLASDVIPRFPAIVRHLVDAHYADNGSVSNEVWHDFKHPRAGEVDEDRLQWLLGDAIWVGEGSAFALPWPADTDEPLTDCLNLLEAIHKKLIPTYPGLDIIRTVLGGRNLATDIPLERPAHVDVLLAIANHLDYVP